MSELEHVFLDTRWLGNRRRPVHHRHAISSTAQVANEYQEKVSGHVNVLRRICVCLKRSLFLLLKSPLPKFSIPVLTTMTSGSITIVSVLRLKSLIQFGNTSNPTCKFPICLFYLFTNKTFALEEWSLIHSFAAR